MMYTFPESVHFSIYTEVLCENIKNVILHDIHNYML